MSFLFVALLGLSVIAPLAHSAVTPGAKCTKAGAKQTYKGKVHTCIALGSKLYWNNGERVLGSSATDSKSPTGKNDARKQCRADQEIELVQIERYLFSARQTLGDLQMKWGLANSTVGIDPKQGLLMKQIEFEMDRLDLNIENLKSNRDKIKEKCIPKSEISTSTKPTPASKRQCTTTEISMIRSLASKYRALNLQIDFFQSEINQQQDLIGIYLLTGKMESIARSNFIIEEQSNLRDSAYVQASFVKQQFDIANLACINSGIKSFEDSLAQAAADKAKADKAAADKAAADKAAADKIKADNLAKICVVGGICKVGNTGPGGGIVFFDAGSQQSWGRYLEFAPLGWSGGSSDPKASWCDSSVTFKTQVEIGTGKTNTDLMLGGCISGAAVMARAYKASGKDDWSLPSKDELTMLCKYWQGQETNYQGGCGGLRPLGGFDLDPYWSSSEYANGVAYAQLIGYSNPFGNNKERAWHVRPVRTF